MFKKVLLAVLVMACSTSVWARGRFTDYVNKGGQRVIVGNSQSFNYVQRSFPGATVTVYQVGTTTKLTIYSTSGGGDLANPFTANSDGSFTFWTDSTQFDITFSGAGITTQCGTGNLPACVGAFTWTNKTYNTGDFTVGVLSVAATSPITTSGATGAITLGCATCLIDNMSGLTSAYQEVQDRETPITHRSILNFDAAAFDVTDNAGRLATDVNLNVSPADDSTLVGASRSITATSPITVNGGASTTLGSDLTLACPTCTTGSAYATIQEEGVSVTQRSTLNIVGGALTAADSGGKTVVTLSQSPAGATSVVGGTRKIKTGYGIAGDCVPWQLDCAINTNLGTADTRVGWDYSTTFANMTALGAGVVVPSCQTSTCGLMYTGSTGGDTNGTYVTVINPTGQRTITYPDASTSLPIFSQFITFSGPSAARTVTLLDTNYTTARQDAAQTFTGVQTFGSKILLPDGSAGAPSVGRSSSTNTGLWLESQAFGYQAGTGSVKNDFTNITTNRTVTWQDEAQTPEAIVGTVNLALQSASIGTTTIITPPAGGLHYRVCWNQQITRAATTSSSLLTTIGWNNGGTSKTATVASLNGGAYQTTADTTNTVGSEMGNCLSVLAGSGGNLTYATTYASTGGTTMQYKLRITVTRLQ